MYEVLNSTPIDLDDDPFFIENHYYYYYYFKGSLMRHLILSLIIPNIVTGCAKVPLRCTA